MNERIKLDYDFNNQIQEYQNLNKNARHFQMLKILLLSETAAC